MATTRRRFVGAGLAAAAANAMAQQTGNGIPTRRLGKTDEQVSILCMGGYHIGSAGKRDEADAVRIIHEAIDSGINFFDNAWLYHDGYAEEILGKGLMGGWRDKVFLMTKNSGRDYKFSKQCLEDSLRRLQTDHIDLWQFHEINYDNDPDWVFERGGLKAALEAQREGKVRFIGFTGHKDPRIHARMLQKPYDWATSQMPINVMDYYYRSFQNEIVPLCNATDVGVIGMKSLGGGFDDGMIPEAGVLTAEECVRFALSRPIASLCRGWVTREQMMADIEIARGFQPLSEAGESAILAKAKPVAGDGRLEVFKSRDIFDDPFYRKIHGFSEEQ